MAVEVLIDLNYIFLFYFKYSLVENMLVHVNILLRTTDIQLHS